MGVLGRLLPGAQQKSGRAAQPVLPVPLLFGQDQVGLRKVGVALRNVDLALLKADLCRRDGDLRPGLRKPGACEVDLRAILRIVDP